MTTGFIIAVVIMFVLIIGITIVVTNKAYGRKPDVIDPIKPLPDPNKKETDQ
ncbi:hypothetical protein BRE01_63810 [Brevibacillus reuszeri]|uniref:YtzI protein n=1 Tax=Brevibacillus reuszeri TaxID=54915 RepID=A0ABQ0TY12_9BACL|nr:hypothetical protein [Brevibacillus reuszeri]MED1857079.1 hypothetical protein [Brevibacillus reuszeri]GED72679.1 hypothetical protein BRE01_63810 [Brevibacillus reuszeri]